MKNNLGAPDATDAIAWDNTGGAKAARAYWDGRAERFAGVGAGLGAVASFGMPRFYNLSIDFVQWLALRKWMGDLGGCTVLDVGCGIGRWSRRFARHGARVVGVDASIAMLSEARRRTVESGLEDRCTFLAGDVTRLRLKRRFERIFAVTVLQHVVDDRECLRAIEHLTGLLEPTGKLVLLEVAPRRADRRCDGPWFASRSFATYLASFRAAGLELVAMRGVDPSLLRTRLLPRYGSWPRPLATAVMFGATALATPFDATFGNVLAPRSWHKVMVLKHAV